MVVPYVLFRRSHMNTINYIQITRLFSYCELCLLEDALNRFKPSDLSEQHKLLLEQLRLKIRAARGWSHHYNKTER